MCQALVQLAFTHEGREGEGGGLSKQSHKVEMTQCPYSGKPTSKTKVIA